MAAARSNTGKKIILRFYKLVIHEFRKMYMNKDKIFTFFNYVSKSKLIDNT